VADRQTDGQTDGIAVAGRALAMGALRRSVKMMLSSLGEYFGATALNGHSLARKFASFIFGSLMFLSINISQGNITKRLWCGGIFNYRFPRTKYWQN